MKFYWFEMVLGRSASLHFLPDGGDHHFLQGLIAIGSINCCCFGFLIAFASSGKIGDESLCAHHAAVS